MVELIIIILNKVPKITIFQIIDYVLSLSGRINNNYYYQNSINNFFLNYITTLSGNVNAYLISLSGRINDLYYNKIPFNGITNNGVLTQNNPIYITNNGDQIKFNSTNNYWNFFSINNASYSSSNDITLAGSSNTTIYTPLFQFFQDGKFKINYGSLTTQGIINIQH